MSVRPAVVAALAAVLLAVTSGVVLVAGGGGDDADGEGAARTSAVASDERTEVLDRAERAVVALTTIDLQDPASSLHSWQDVTTGALLASLQREQGSVQRLIGVGETATTSAVQEAAVQTIDVAEGTATVLVGLDITLAPVRGRVAVEPQRLVATMERTDDGWRAADLASVPAGAGAAPVAPPGSGSSAEAAVLSAVSAGIEELWSYDHRDLEATAAAPPSVTTAAFREGYADVGAGIRALAPQVRAVVAADVVRAAVQSLDGERAVVLVFLNQTAEQQGAPATSAGARLRVVAELEDGAWKVAEASSF